MKNATHEVKLILGLIRLSTSNARRDKNISIDVYRVLTDIESLANKATTIEEFDHINGLIADNFPKVTDDKLDMISRINWRMQVVHEKVILVKKLLKWQKVA